LNSLWRGSFPEPESKSPAAIAIAEKGGVPFPFQSLNNEQENALFAHDIGISTSENSGEEKTVEIAKSDAALGR
jgi:hypothetical protein